MDENWTRNDPQQVARVQHVWNAIEAGDFAAAIDSNADNVIFENGPGAGPWRRTDGKDAFVEMSMKFIPIFGDSWKQFGTCVFANEQFAVTLVGEMGTHAESGDVFDNRAVYVTRFDEDGKTDRVWTVDLDSEDMETFWQRNPVTEP
jgi:ketosteroid isomerase-like protein